MRDDEIDRILDAALLNYSSAEPRPGLEQRVLYRVRSGGGAGGFACRLWRWRWAAAFPAVACLLVFALYRDSAPEPPRVTQTIRNAAPRPIPEAPKLAVRKHRATAKRVSLPKRDQFPTPAPLTDAERAWMDFVTRSPEQAREVAVHAVEWGEAPIQIEEIQIPPLPGGG
jgi:hypothetical protein